MPTITSTKPIAAPTPETTLPHIQHVGTIDEFASTVAQPAVAVMFTAAWCGPCRMLAPVLHDAVGAFNARQCPKQIPLTPACTDLQNSAAPHVALSAVDIDALPAIAVQYGVTSVPHVVVFRGGQAAASFSGAQTRDYVSTFLCTAMGISSAE